MKRPKETTQKMGQKMGTTLRSERGQASLMIGMMMMTFILLFAFVVNTGMLVNAKINLQNAADLAAYAGAAVQARQMNNISYLNYEMRRQYKKFLFRYYVIGNMASGSFPRPGGGGGGGTPKWGPGPEAPGINYGVPAVCVAFSTTGPLDDYCQAGALKAISIPNSNPLDGINQTLISMLTSMEKLKENNCGKIATANTALLSLWLFNTSPDLQSLIQNTNDTNLQAVMQVTAAAASGLGLVPRELILNERINTLQSYVNMPGLTGVKKATVDALSGGIDPASNERTIQAFLSAYYTLGNHTFSDDTHITMDELLPGGGNEAALLALKPIVQSFDTYSVQFQLSGNVVNGAADCDPYLAPVEVTNLPFGVYKDPSVLTFYALRLRATAKVMFSPFGDMTLTAYSAARPFGSRIGPQSPDFTSQGSPTFTTGPAPAPEYDALPNLPFSQSDSPLAAGKGWDNGSVLSAFYNQLVPGGGGANAGNAQPLGEQQFESGAQAAMVPNPIEGNIYNVLNDLPDSFVRSFDALHQISFWAPIVSPANISNLKGLLTEELTGLLPTLPKNGIPAAGNSAPNLIAALSQDIMTYVDKMESGEGEILAGSPDASGRCNPGSCVQEGINIAHISDPFMQANGAPIALGPPIMIQTDQPSLKTSYVTTLDPTYTGQGRVGYSVKFVSFDSLIKTGTDANGGGMIDKPTGFLDSQAQLDTKQIQH